MARREPSGCERGTPGVINAYINTTPTLEEWRFHGSVYDCNEPGQPACYVARPSLLRHPSGAFVLWAKGGGKSFQSATSTSPFGPFVKYGTYDVADGVAAGGSQTTSERDDTAAYMVFSQKPTNTSVRELRVRGLRAADWLTLDTNTGRASLIDTHAEAPVPFYSAVAARYFVWSSHTSGWRPNAAKVHSSASLLGPWVPLGNPSNSSTTFRTQGACVLPLGRTSPGSGNERALYVGDRYEPYINTTEGSRYLSLLT